MGRNGFVALAAVLALAGYSCSGGSGDDTVDSTAAPPTSTVASVGATSSSVGGSTAPAPTTSSSTTTSTSLPPLPDVLYSIEARRTGQGGDTVLVLLPAGTYSDLDLEVIMLDVIERFAPITTAYVVDTLDTDGDGERNAPTVVLEVLERSGGFTAPEASFRADHYFLTLQDGFRVLWRGPFADLAPVILGS